MTRWPLSLVLAGLLALASTSCDKGLYDGDLVVENRTDTELTIYRLHSPEEDSEASNLGAVQARTNLVMAGAHGCSIGGFEAREPGGEVIAELRPGRRLQVHLGHRRGRQLHRA